MIGLAEKRRGQPLVVLATLLVLWIGARVMVWESPFPPVAEALGASVSLVAGGDAVAEQPQRSFEVAAVRGSRYSAAALSSPEALPAFERRLAVARVRPIEVAEVKAARPTQPFVAEAPLPALSGIPTARAEPEHRDGTTMAARPERWSLDSWVLLRPDSSGEAVAGVRPAAYGSSQAGAVVRYRLAPGSSHRPTVYGRATQALAAVKESEVAAGIAARPIPRVPVSIYAEMRATRAGTGGVEFRPAAFAVTELPPLALPFRLRGEAYVQAGYVGGTFATAFVDGQARIDREVARIAGGAVRAGAGVWGGAQKGAARLDVGPSAAVHLDLGIAPVRLALDYRVRVAGEAAPGTGVAVTLSTGF